MVYSEHMIMLILFKVFVQSYNYTNDIITYCYKRMNRFIFYLKDVKHTLVMLFIMK